jgi:hypothetical protein
VGPARIVRIISLALIGCLMILLCAEAGVKWYTGRQDEALKPSPTKIAIMTDQANAAIELKNARPLYPLQDDLLAAINMPNDFALHYRVSDIPDSVRTSFAKAAEEETFSMAEPGGAWEATDVIRDPRLPQRRLTTVAICGAFCLVFYEHGGIGRSNNVAAFRQSHDTAEPVWHAYLEPSIADPAALRDAIERKRFRKGFF